MQAHLNAMEQQLAANNVQAAGAQEQAPNGAQTPNGAQPHDAGNSDAASMTIQKIKVWLMEHGHEGDVWELAKRHPRATKAEWVALMSNHQ